MDPGPLFALQFFWFLLVWAAVATLFVGPAIAHLHPDDALAVWVVPQLFRVLGVGLLVPNLAPDMPGSFALPTAVGDSFTASLALVSVVALRRRWSAARAFAWICNFVGAADLSIALPHAASIQAARFLAGQWYVPAAGIPLMVVSHVMAFRALLRGRSRS